jgi:ribonucleoside-diphosphate reductase alpha chain
MTPLEITVTKRDGTKAQFNADRINRAIERVCSDLPNATEMVMQVATETSLTLYDGVTEDELDEAVINAALQNIQHDPNYDIVAKRILLKTIYARVLGDYDKLDKEAPQILHEKRFPEHVKQWVDRGLMDRRMIEKFDLPELSKALDISRDELFNYAGLSGLLNRYSLKGETQKAIETPQFTFMRIAMGLAFNEENPNEVAKKFYEKISKLEYLPGGSTNLNAGTVMPALSNCILLEVHDSMDHIAKSVSDIMLLSKGSAGIGASITKLRASGSPLSSSNTVSSGPIPFLKIIDVAIRAIQRGGKKKGALAFYMENWHIDFPDFVEARFNNGDEHLRFRTADTAAFISDEFMKRVRNGEQWYLFDPKEVPDLNELYGEAFSRRYNEYIQMAESGKMRMYRKVPAREQYRQITASLVSTSHPWITYKDAINLRAINNNTGTIHMSNLCTEICLPQDKDNIAVCNLASINLTQHLKGKDMDWQRLENTVRIAVRHLDNLIDINQLPVQEAINSDQKNRAVGLGVMGLADIFEKMGWSYEHKEAYDFADRLFEFVSYMAIDESANLAQERGSYENFQGSEWSKGKVPIDTLERLEKERGIALTVDKSSKHGGLDWNVLREKVKKGMRNATLMAIAPNANIGLIGGTVPGIDPRFAQVFSRNKISGKYLDININLVNALKERGLWEKMRNKIIETQGDIEKIEDMPQDLKDIYKTSFTTSPYAFIEIAARAQKWVDQALSRNMYLRTRDNEEIMKIYATAWEKGVKTTYYLHMEPRHTAEQSTSTVNKGVAMGKTGFGAIKAKMAASAPEPVVVQEVVAREVPSDTEVQKPKYVVVNRGNGPIDPAEANVCDSCQ